MEPNALGTCYIDPICVCNKAKNASSEMLKTEYKYLQEF